MNSEINSHHNQLFDLYSLFKSSMFGKNTSWLQSMLNRKSEYLDYHKLGHQRDIIFNSLENVDKPLNLFIVGEGKYGKSTLINALLGTEVADVDFLPKTWRIDLFKYGKDGAVLSYDDGKKEQLSIEDAKSIVSAEEKKAKSDKNYESPLIQVEWFYNKPSLKLMSIVDTPGIKQIRSQNAKITIEEHYYKADGVLWLLNATKLGGEVEETFLKKFLTFRKRIIGIINKWDTIALFDQDKVLNRARDCFGEYFVDIVPVSAKNGFKGKEMGDSSLIEESNLPVLESKIQTFFGKDGKITKNIAIYYNFLEAMRESKEILSSEAECFYSNVKIYDCSLKNITKKHSEVIENSNYKIEKTVKSYFSEIYKRIDYNTSFRTIERNMDSSIIDKYRLEKNMELLKGEVVNLIKNEFYSLIQKLASSKYEERDYNYDGSLFNKIELPTHEDIETDMNFIIPEVSISIQTPWINKAMEFMQNKPILGAIFDVFCKEKHQRDLENLKQTIKSQVKPWEGSILSKFLSNSNVSCDRMFENLEKEIKYKFKELFGEKDGVNSLIEKLKFNSNKCKIKKYVVTSSFLELLKEVILKGR